MIVLSNPRMREHLSDWPIGGSNRGECRFEVEHDSKRGFRVRRSTTNRHGVWCKPKYTTYASAMVIVDGEDDQVYLLREVSQYGFVEILRSDFKVEEVVHKSSSPDDYETLMGLISRGALREFVERLIIPDEE